MTAQPDLIVGFGRARYPPSTMMGFSYAIRRFFAARPRPVAGRNARTIPRAWRADPGLTPGKDLRGATMPTRRRTRPAAGPVLFSSVPRRPVVAATPAGRSGTGAVTARLRPRTAVVTLVIATLLGGGLVAGAPTQAAAGPVADYTNPVLWQDFPDIDIFRVDNTYYWGCCVDFANTHIYTATAVEGPWQRHTTINKCYYDAGLLVDDDDTMYVAYGNTKISVAQLSADGRSEVRSQQVFSTPSNIGTLEGARFYKINGSYYIFLTRPANGQYILKAANPFGPYTLHQVLLNMPTPIPGGGVPHQGGLVQTQNGQWYYMAFVDAFPGGRVPVLAPVTWTADGWPQVRTVNGGWGASYPFPNLPPHPVRPMTGLDTFPGPALGPDWEWNHNPDTTKFSVSNWVRMGTATVTTDLYSARNTLTHRIQGPTSTATVALDLTGMRDGDRTGLAMLRDSSAWIGIRRDGGRNRGVMVANITMDGSWNTTSTGTEVAGTGFGANRIWLRANADIRPGAGRQARFSYSTDGVTFTSLGPAFTLNNNWTFFMGYRFAVFNYATQALGGTVTLQRFDLSTP